MSNLATPYRLTPSVVRAEVEPGRVGAYALGNDRGGFKVGYVGRSDACLQTRLAYHNHAQHFDYFVFRYATNDIEAFYLECEFWHYCHKLRIRNSIHPASPQGSGLRCPFCSFATQIGDMMKG